MSYEARCSYCRKVPCECYDLSQPSPLKFVPSTASDGTLPDRDELRSQNAALRERIAELEAQVAGLQRALNSATDYRDVYQKKADRALERNAELVELVESRLKLEKCITNQRSEIKNRLLQIHGMERENAWLRGIRKRVRTALGLDGEDLTTTGISDPAEAAKRICKERDRALSELAEAKKDTERLDWLEWYIREGFKQKLVTKFERFGDLDDQPLREAIDGARAAIPGKTKAKTPAASASPEDSR